VAFFLPSAQRLSQSGGLAGLSRPGVPQQSEAVDVDRGQFEGPAAMMRISLDSPALTAVCSLLAGVTGQPTPRAGRSGRRKASRLHFRGEQLEPRMMLDAGMRAILPDLVAESDTGASNSDNVTFDRAPELTGSVRGALSQVRLFIDGRGGDLLPVTNGTWTHEVPATAALTPGGHTFAGRPVHTSGRVGPLSRWEAVRVDAEAEAEREMQRAIQRQRQVDWGKIF